MKMSAKLYLIILFYGFLLFDKCQSAGTVGHLSPPVPGLPASDPKETTTTEKQGPKEPLYITNYIPAVMQTLAYFTEMLGYQLNEMTTIEPPLGSTDSTSTTTPRPTTTTRRTTTTTPRTTTRWTSTTTPRTTTTTRRTTTTTTTTRRPTTTTRRTTTTPRTTRRSTTPWTTTTTPAYELTTQKHKPGIIGPDKPPSPVASNNQWQTNSRPTTTTESHVTVDINNQFFNWFFQSKPKQLELDFDYNLQLLDPYPRGLLQDIQYEGYDAPTLLDSDNVNEFLRVYDDFYGNYKPLTGKKKTPPTKPYIEMLMLYDLLKREAKSLMFNKYDGYSDELLEDLIAISKRSSERQLHTLLTKMIERKDTMRPDIIARATTMIKDLENPSTIISMSLRYIPPLSFMP